MADGVPMNFIERNSLVFVSVDSLHKWLEESVAKLDANKTLPFEQHEHYVEAIKMIQLGILQAMFEARGERQT